MSEREFDIVLFGATGFVGKLTAEYLAAHAPEGLRIALAGRNRAKMEALAIDLPLIEADSDDPASLARMAASTRILLSTVGPYAIHGEPLVKACAEAGTDYADLTGEPGFVDAMYLKYDALARSTGARLIHCAGFDSIPHDLGVYFTVLQLPEGEPIRIESRVRASGTYSGGTFHSALNGFAHAGQTIGAARKRMQAEPKPTTRRIGRIIKPLQRDRSMGMWVAPLPTIDQFVVERSATTLERYGPDFKYGHNYAAKSLSTVALGTAAVASVFVAAQIPPVRNALLRRVPPGSGPSEERRARSHFRVEFVGTSGETSVRTAISGGDAGYDETAKMLAETAFALALDDIPKRSGQLTPVVAVGDSLLVRLPAAGIELEVL